ncbi:MAG TPA: hypothetical protein DEG69_07600 [Flavobacteriaceae bacterium]|nr:hypothetical protein [Parvibaculum sp.]HBY67612.1 hypothetical protein [Flavobacteriaceae bacterium]
MIRETHQERLRQDIPVINTPRVTPEQIAEEIKLFNERVLAKQDITNQLLARQFDDGKAARLVELYGDDPEKKRVY